MKLLIVEDEEMTREGLIESLPWEELGITEILQARDGLQGLDMASEEHPGIILCDIRMPRMDGLTMLEKVHEIHPEIIFILLTGHAEVGYLKRAINLNVIRFIEKPVNLEELKEALGKAVEQVAAYQRQLESAQIHSTVVASRLAYQMTFPYNSCKPVIDSLLQDFMVHYGTDKFRYITTFIVRPEQLPENSMLLYAIGQKLHDRLIPGHYHIIYTDRVPKDIIYHVYGAIRPSPATLMMIGDIIRSYYKTSTRCYVSVGDSVSGIRNAWHSYESAKTRLNYARFYEADTVLYDRPVASGQEEADEDRPLAKADQSDMDDAISSLPQFFRTSLEDRDEKKSLDLLEEFRGIWYHSTCRESLVKSAYYSMFLIINQMYHTLHIDTDITLEHPGLILDAIDSAFSFFEIDALIREKTDEFFFRLSHRKEEDGTIYRIKEYINSHYRDQNLSVKSISENVFLSVSYLCTYFKNETGITLNQYITDFRMKKAMHLLGDTNMKIVDVAGAVGYRDSNYFAKIFKKQTGFSPKEYKNKSVQ